MQDVESVAGDLGCDRSDFKESEIEGLTHDEIPMCPPWGQGQSGVTDWPKGTLDAPGLQCPEAH